MSKEKILGIKNTEDSIWIKIKPSDKLIKIFNDLAFFKEFEFKNSYSHLKYNYWKDKEFIIDTERMLAYIIFGDKVNLILRKVKDYKLIKENFLEFFEFQK